MKKLDILIIEMFFCFVLFASEQDGNRKAPWLQHIDRRLFAYNSQEYEERRRYVYPIKDNQYCVVFDGQNVEICTTLTKAKLVLQNEYFCKNIEEPACLV